MYVTKTNSDVCDRIFARIPPGTGAKYYCYPRRIIVNRVEKRYGHLSTLDKVFLAIGIHSINCFTTYSTSV